MWRDRLRAACWLPLLLVLGTCRADGRLPEVVVIQPLGSAPREHDLAVMRDALVTWLSIDVEIASAIPLPESAWHAPRQRHRAERLIEHLGSLQDEACWPSVRILGVTTRDISTARGDLDWGVVGLARLGGAAGVVSTFRTGRLADRELRRERLAKVAVHEVCHVLGLPHCDTPGCIMGDARGRLAVVDAGKDLCSWCRSRLAAVSALPRDPFVPPCAREAALVK